MPIMIVTSDDCNICTELKKELPASKYIRYIDVTDPEATGKKITGVPSAFLETPCVIMKDDKGEYSFNCQEDYEEEE